MNLKKGEYQELKAAKMKLQALEEAGVDNWVGYEDAITRVEEALEQEEDFKDRIEDFAHDTSLLMVQMSETGTGFGIEDEDAFDALKDTLLIDLLSIINK